MVRPDLCAWIEEGAHFVGLRVNTSQIRALVAVAVLAGEGQIGGIVSAAMLFGSDVLYMELRERGMLLKQPAVFAPIVGSLSDELPQSDIHQV